MNDAFVALEGVSKGFGGVPILRGVDLAVRRGETLVVIGESGCGKSVTMKLLMGLLRPDAGTVRWEGRDVREIPPADLRKRRLRFGYLFQGAALFDSLSVFENIAFGLRQNTRMTDGVIDAVVRARTHEVGLPEVALTRKPSELSGGMKKRVGLARALALEPELMCYDEPTTGLDPVMSDVINELIVQTQAKTGATAIVVTHDMRTVERVADRVVMLEPASRLAPDEPQVIYDGPPAGAFASTDDRVRRFVRGESSERLKQLATV
ncbi:MAG: ATP-binding cassette domain-containing protein [Planctomycetota bacterium]